MKNQKNERYFTWDVDEEPEGVDAVHVVFAVSFIMLAITILVHILS